MAKHPADRAVRTEQVAAAAVEFEPLPFDAEAAGRYGTLVALVLAANRSPASAEAGPHDRCHRVGPRTAAGLERMVEVVPV